MMTRHLALANLVYLSLVLQPVLPGLIPAKTVGPWLPGIALVVCVLFSHELAGIAWAFLLGLCVDCLSLHLLGANTIIATCIASCIRLFQEEEHRPGFLVCAALTFVVTFVWLSLSLLTHGLLEHVTIEFESLTQMPFRTAAVTASLIVVMWMLQASWSYVFTSRDPNSIELANHWTMLTEK